MPLFVQLRYGFGFHSYNTVGSVKEEELPLIFQIAFFIPFVIIAWFVYRAYKKYNRKCLKNGLFIKDLKVSQDTIIEAYICLAVVMVKRERIASKEKMHFIKKHIIKYFPGNSFDVYHKIKTYYKENIVISSVTDWLNLNTDDDLKKSNLLYFLAGIAAVDGEIKANELDFLKELTRLFNLSDSELESVLHSYSYFEQKKQQETQENYQKQKQQQSSSRPNYNYSASMLESSLKILGLNNGATIDEVKSAYRKLAKLNHPDRFMNEDQAHQKIAHERFLKIQEAYEYVLKRMN
jgi:DnaJ like chaperone protein